MSDLNALTPDQRYRLSMISLALTGCTTDEALSLVGNVIVGTLFAGFDGAPPPDLVDRLGNDFAEICARYLEALDDGRVKTASSGCVTANTLQ